MAENQNIKSRREQFSERLKKKHPDSEYTDDEALFGQINDDYDEYDKQIEGYSGREKELTDLMVSDPRAAQFLTDMAKGNDPWLAVINRLGIDGVTDLINDPSKQEAYAEENKKYVERLAKNKELDEQYEQNFAKSLDVLSDIQQKQGLTDEQIDAAYDLIIKIANDAVLGIISEETVNMALKAVNHDNDVQTAGEEGRIAGKNEKAEEKLRKPQRGDGTPTLNGSNNAPTRKNRQQSIFSLAEEAM